MLIQRRKRLLTAAVAACVAATGPLVGCGTLSQSVAITPAGGSEPLDPTGIEEVSLESLEVTDISAPEGTPAEVPQPPAPLGPNGKMHEITRDTPFSMFALTWQGVGNVEAQVRALQADGTYGDWYELHGLSTTSNSPEANPDKRGSDPIFVGTTTSVQVVIDGDGEAVLDAQAEAQAEAEAGPVDIARPMIQQPLAPNADGPTEDVRAVLIRPSSAPVSGAVADGPTDIAAPVKPPVISRAQWGADESKRCMQPSYSDGLGGVTIHHTAGNNNYTQSESAQIVRGIYAYHAQTLGWCDIGYQALVDKYGQIFEGRFGGMDRDVEGAHAGGFNENTAGYSMIGDFTSVAPPAATITALGNLVGWRTMIGNLDPVGTSTHYSEGTQFTWVPAGGAIRLPNIFAHRDVGYTECPGDLGYQYLPQIRQLAAAYHKTYGSGPTDEVPVGGSPTTPVSGDPNTPTTEGTSSSDLLRRNAAADVEDQAAAAAAAAPAEAVVAEAAPESPVAAEAPAAEAPAAEVPAAAAPAEAEAAPAEAPTAEVPTAEAKPTGPTAAQIDAIMPRLVGMLRGSLTDAFTPYIAERWVELGGAAGALGNIVNGVTAGANEVQYATFDNGSIYWSPDVGAQAVWGAIGEHWIALGAENSELGLPTSDEYEVTEGIRVDFQRGQLTFNRETGEISVTLTGTTAEPAVAAEMPAA